MIVSWRKKKQTRERAKISCTGSSLVRRLWDRRRPVPTSPQLPPVEGHLVFTLLGEQWRRQRYREWRHWQIHAGRKARKYIVLTKINWYLNRIEKLIFETWFFCLCLFLFVALVLNLGSDHSSSISAWSTYMYHVIVCYIGTTTGILIIPKSPPLVQLDLPVGYSWIPDQQDAHEKLICQRTRRATTIPRPPLESSQWEEFRFVRSIFVYVGIILKVTQYNFQKNA